MFVPNKYQEAVFNNVECQNDNIVVVARAGTGKTTTILQAVDLLDPDEDGTILITAFNKAIQKELDSRAPSHVDVRTLHSLGYGCLKRVENFQVDSDRTKRLIRKLIGGAGFAPGRQSALTRLVGLAKNTLTMDAPGLQALAYAHGIDEPENPAKLLAELTLVILEACKKDLAYIDFDDMIWLPAVMDLKPKCYDNVFVDEAQDLNACQRWMIEGTLRRGGRIIAVGDDRQAIYKWRGAGGDVLTDIQNQFNATKLPLSLTYRCPKKVVALAKRIVPDFEPLPDAPEGEVIYKSMDDISVEATPGDLVLSRVNGPLLSICLSLIENDVPAKVRGKDIGKSLSALARKSKTTLTSELASWLKSYRAREKERLLPDHEDAFSILQDKIYCLEILLRKHTTVNELCQKIEEVFSDTDSTGYVLCSTVHKAKGMERPRVWVLADTFRLGSNREEDNIYYVAITRAQKVLVFVGGGAPIKSSGREAVSDKLDVLEQEVEDVELEDDYWDEDEEDDVLCLPPHEEDEDEEDEDWGDDEDDEDLDW